MNFKEMTLLQLKHMRRKRYPWGKYIEKESVNRADYSE